MAADDLRAESSEPIFGLAVFQGLRGCRGSREAVDLL